MDTSWSSRSWRARTLTPLVGSQGHAPSIRCCSPSGVIAWEAVEPAERAKFLRQTLVTRPTPEEYAAFVAELTNPVMTLMVSMADGDAER